MRTRAKPKTMFRSRLRALGCATYGEYLKSDHWRRIHQEYQASKLPHECLICGDPHYQLHHRSYTRIGRELLLDLMPLCRACHLKLHALKDVSLHTPHRSIMAILGVTKTKAMRKLRRISMARGNRWLPRGKSDLCRLKNLLGRPAMLLQHNRLFPGEPLSCVYAMTPAQAADYCRRLCDPY